MAKKVLIVDDSTTIRQVLRITLEQECYEIIEAENGRHALDIFEDSGFDLLVTDLNMPEIDGIGLIKEIRRRPGGRLMPIIMLTTESQAEKREAGKAAGASGWITKPFKPEQLLAIARTVCPA